MRKSSNKLSLVVISYFSKNNIKNCQCCNPYNFNVTCCKFNIANNRYSNHKTTDYNLFLLYLMWVRKKKKMNINTFVSGGTNLILKRAVFFSRLNFSLDFLNAFVCLIILHKEKSLKILHCLFPHIFDLLPTYTLASLILLLPPPPAASDVKLKGTKSGCL